MSVCLLFVRFVLLPVIVEYHENEDNNKDCLLEMLELALHYLVLFEGCLEPECVLLITTIQQLLVSINTKQVSRNNEATHRGRPKVMIDRDFPEGVWIYD